MPLGGWGGGGWVNTPATAQTQHLHRVSIWTVFAIPQPTNNTTPCLEIPPPLFFFRNLSPCHTNRLTGADTRSAHLNNCLRVSDSFKGEREGGSVSAPFKGERGGGVDFATGLRTACRPCVNKTCSILGVPFLSILTLKVILCKMVKELA